MQSLFFIAFLFLCMLLLFCAYLTMRAKDEVRKVVIFACFIGVYAIVTFFSYYEFGTMNLFTGTADAIHLQAQLKEKEKENEDAPNFYAVSGTEWPHAYYLADKDATGDDVKRMFIDIFGTESRYKISDIQTGDEWGAIYDGVLPAGQVHVSRRWGHLLVEFISLNYAT